MDYADYLEAFLSCRGHSESAPDGGFSLPGDKPHYARDKVVDYKHFRLDISLDLDAKRVAGSDGQVTGLECVRVEWRDREMVEIPGTAFTMPADLILLAMGFLGPRRQGLLEQAGVELDQRSNVRADTFSYTTSRRGVFACGDMRRGQSLIVWAIREGRQCARAVDEMLMGVSELPR